MTFPTGWTHRVTITIDHLKVVGTPTNYVGLIDLTNLPSTVVDAGVTSAQDGGGDIRLTSDLAGTTLLPIEIAAFHPDATAGSRTCKIFFSGITPSSVSDTVIYLWCNYSLAGLTKMPQPAQGVAAIPSVWDNGADYRFAFNGNDAVPPAYTGLQLTVWPRSKEFSGATYFHFYDHTNSQGRVAKYTHSTGQWSVSSAIYTSPTQEPHCSGTLTIDSAGYIYIATVGYDGNNLCRMFKSTNPSDISAWGAAVNITANGAIPSFAQIRCLANDHLLFFYRNNGINVNRFLSTDAGATWGNEQTLITPIDGFPYWVFKVGTSGRLHLLWHSRYAGGPVNINYIYSDNPDATTSAWKAANAAAITLPITTAPSTVSTGLVFDTTAFDAGPYCIGLAVDGSDNPVVLAGLFSSTTSNDEIAAFTYAAGTWTKRTIVTGVKVNVGSAEVRAEGDIKFVSGTTWRAIFAINVSSVWEIQEWESTDGAVTWGKIYDLTTGSLNQNRVAQYVEGGSGPIVATWFSAVAGTGQGSELYASAMDNVWWTGSHSLNAPAIANDIYPVSTSFVRDSTKWQNQSTSVTLNKSSAAHPAQTTGLIGTGGHAQLAASGDFINAGHAASLLSTGDCCWDAWCKFTNAAGTQEDIFGKNPSGTYGMQLTRAVLGSNFVLGDASPNFRVAVSASAVAAATLYHFSAGRTVNTVVMRVDKSAGGTTDAATDDTALQAASDMKLFSGSGHNMTGIIDVARFANTYLATDTRDTQDNNYRTPSTFAAGTEGPAVVPGEPTIGTAAATGSTTANFPFTAPASNGGDTIDQYRLTVSPGGATFTLSQAGSGTIAATGLSPSTSCTGTVAAHNSAGWSAESSASNSITTTSGAGGGSRTGSNARGATGRTGLIISNIRGATERTGKS